MRKIKVGDMVKIVKNTAGSINTVGSVGEVCEDKYGDGTVFRVVVNGISEDNFGNGSVARDLKLILTKEEKIERLLRKIRKLNKQ